MAKNIGKFARENDMWEFLHFRVFIVLHFSSALDPSLTCLRQRWELFAGGSFGVFSPGANCLLVQLRFGVRTWLSESARASVHSGEAAV